MKNKSTLFILFLGLAVIVTIALNVDSTETPKNVIQNTNKLATASKPAETAVKNQAIVPSKFDEKLNKYADRSKKYNVLYPNNLDLFETGPAGINFAEKDLDGPWLINITTQETTAKDVYDWLKTQNQNRKDLPAMTIQKTFKRDGTTFLYLNDPIVVDHDQNQKPIYSSMDTVVAIKNGQLFKLIKRELWDDPNKPTTFDIVIQNFNIL